MGAFHDKCGLGLDAPLGTQAECHCAAALAGMGVSVTGATWRGLYRAHVGDRSPISYVYVNSKMGSNTLAFDGFGAGGGGRAGPYRIDGDTVKIDWLLSTTLDQQEKEGLRPEKHSLILPMPKREKGQDDFCVLFLPDNKPLVRWATSCHIDMQDEFNIYRTRK
ncbi:hypothetical protein [Aeromonas sp. HMWF014]|uniref:hypothetical protein n=1 Tax=Aeromonas sp. HMWF014 TaxID=2056850 RepID=UPI002159D709|nr:hypothetical protein [Aeromonas sp. HMWF014]